MSGASFVLAINMFVAGLFSLAFFLVALNNKTDQVAVWFGTAYLCGVGYFVFEFILPLQPNSKLGGMLAFTSFLAAMATVTVGIARRYRRPVPWRTIAVICTLSVLASWIAFELPRESLWRMYAYQTPYAVMPAIAVWIIVRSGRQQPMDLGLGVLFIVTALHFLAKPLISQLTGGPGGSATQYIGTEYALYSQSLSAIVSVATALLMLMVLIRDMLVDATTRSETDPLSGLFNRRGFEDRVEPGLVAASRGAVPAAYIACDLDHFKAVNDTFGHDIGDQVIRAFAGLLATGAPARSIAARMGGEEFAIFLPGTNLSAARLYAEAVRAGFAALRLDGIAPGMQLSASFGVAETEPGENLPDLRRRADAALYSAKRAGRDRVVVAAPAGFDAMPSHPLTPGAPKRKSVR